MPLPMQDNDDMPSRLKITKLKVQVPVGKQHNFKVIFQDDSEESGDDEDSDDGDEDSDDGLSLHPSDCDDGDRGDGELSDPQEC